MNVCWVVGSYTLQVAVLISADYLLLFFFTFLTGISFQRLVREEQGLNSSDYTSKTMYVHIV